jgi:hypothetical protein
MFHSHDAAQPEPLRSPKSDQPALIARLAAMAAKTPAQTQERRECCGAVNGIVTAGGSKAAWFKDTEGNIMP